MKRAVIKLDDPKFPGSGATILEVSDEDGAAIRARYADKDGCVPAWFRVINGEWMGTPHKPGDRVRGLTEGEERLVLDGFSRRP